MAYVDVVSWQDELDHLLSRVGGRFGRSEPRRRARRYVGGLVAGLERKNGWTLAEHAGEVSPDGMQRLLRWADWDVDGVRDDVRDYVVDRLGDAGAVLAVDDTGFIKKGVRSAGVQRQYTGTSGKKDNCQIGTFLAYIAPTGHALIDRHLYLPESWTSDPDRRADAGVPEEVEFQTKPRVAIAMLQRVLDAQVPFAWFTADEAFGQAKYLRVWLAEHDIAHVPGHAGAADDNGKPDNATTADARRSHNCRCSRPRAARYRPMPAATAVGVSMTWYVKAS